MDEEKTISGQNIKDLRRLYATLRDDLPDAMGFSEFLDDFEEFCS